MQKHSILLLTPAATNYVFVVILKLGTKFEFTAKHVCTASQKNAAGLIKIEFFVVSGHPRFR